MQYKDNWEETKQRFDAWYRRQKTDGPLLNLNVIRDKPLTDMRIEESFTDYCDMHLNPDKKFSRTINFFNTVKFAAEGYPQFGIDMGAGSMALYLGAEPQFTKDTVWFEHIEDKYDTLLPLKYDSENIWWKKHLEIIERQVELVKGTDIIVNIPDIIENIDILSALRSPQVMCFDLYDYPDEVHNAISQLGELYNIYYDAIYDRVKTPDGCSSFTYLGLYGTGKTAKIQCDIAAMLSPGQFRDFVLPSLKNQCKFLDNTVFHLDGPECICHVDALMEIDELSAVQWMPGAGKPQQADPVWYDLYRKIVSAGKGILIDFFSYSLEDGIEHADRLIKEFGKDTFYFHFPLMSEKDADNLLLKAEKHWK